jgi:hypothetical protein
MPLFERNILGINISSVLGEGDFVSGKRDVHNVGRFRLDGMELSMP